MPEDSQFKIDRIFSGQLTVTFSNPPINMYVPTTIVELRALMPEFETDPSLKVIVFKSANPDFFVAKDLEAEGLMSDRGTGVGR